MYKIFFMMGILITLLGSCHPQDSKPVTDKICKDRTDHAERPCSVEELSFIKDWNWIAEKIASFDINKFEEKFLSIATGNEKNPHVALLGEVHNHIEGILDNWGYINYLAKKGKINVFLEGAEFREEEEKDNNKTFFKISQIIEIYLEKKLFEMGLAYHPSKWDKLKADGFKPAVDNFFSAIEHLKQPVQLKNINFNHWDKRGEKDYKYINMVTRNTSMINIITQKLTTEKDIPIIVIAGLDHLPLGDYFVAAKRIPDLKLDFPPNFGQFYFKAAQFRLSTLHDKNKAEKYYEERVGATKVIYDSLSKLNVDVVQAIPRSSLKFWEKLTSRL